MLMKMILVLMVVLASFFGLELVGLVAAPLNRAPAGSLRKTVQLASADRAGGKTPPGPVASDVAQPGPTFTVTTTDEHDDGVCGMSDCTLHEAVDASNANPDTSQIIFVTGLTGTITTDKLTTPGGLEFTSPVTIVGPGSRALTISGNHAARVFFGGFTQVEIDGLTIADGFGDEGAIVTFDALTLNNCTLSGNTANDGGSGGGIHGEYGSTITLTDCTFRDNVAEGKGGALFGFGLIATNCTFFNNVASSGGAIFAVGGGMIETFVHCTVFGNHASGTGTTAGGGIFNNGPKFDLGSSLIAGNTSGDMVAPDAVGTFNSLGYNVIGQLSAGSSGFIDGVNHDQVGADGAPLDPRVDPAGLQPNGGPTDTIALLGSGPAVETGDPANMPERDQRDYDRNGDPDVGAFELGGTIPKTLANISTRLSVGTEDNVLVGGFIITGTHSKSVLLRAIGPSLSVAGALANPTLELYDGSGAIIATNDDWQTNANEQEIIDTGISPNDPLESALLITLDPGLYTAIVRGANDGTGIALVEAYDLDRTTDAKLANISTRGLVQIDDNVMIGGFIVIGSESQDVLVRALGPSLPVLGKLADPILELHNADGAILASNNNWQDSQEEEIAATGIPPTDKAESAIVMTLAPAAYTVIIRGVDNTTGVALVEVYGLN